MQKAVENMLLPLPRQQPLQAPRHKQIPAEAKSKRVIAMPTDVHIHDASGQCPPEEALVALRRQHTERVCACRLVQRHTRRAAVESDAPYSRQYRLFRAVDVLPFVDMLQQHVEYTRTVVAKDVNLQKAFSNQMRVPYERCSRGISTHYEALMCFHAEVLKHALIQLPNHLAIALSVLKRCRKAYSPAPETSEFQS